MIAQAHKFLFAESESEVRISPSRLDFDITSKTEKPLKSPKIIESWSGHAIDD